MDENETLPGCTSESDRPAPQLPAEDWAAGSSHAPNVLSLFSGAGGLDSGLEFVGLSPCLMSEIDKDALETIKANRPDIPVIGNIHGYTAAQVRAASIGDAEITLVVGGPPCQAFSSAGKRQGLDDIRGIAVLKFVSLATELAPRYIVIENVRGLLDAKGGEVLEKILAMLRSGGYTVSFNLYDTAYFGVPQHRDRVIIIGSRVWPVPYLKPTHSDRPEDGLPPLKTLRNAIGDMKGIPHHFVQFPDRRLEHFQKLQSGQNWRDLSEEDQRAALSEAVRAAEGGKSGFYRRLAWDEPCPTLVSLPNMPATDLCHPERTAPDKRRGIQADPGISGPLAIVRRHRRPIPPTGQRRPDPLWGSGGAGDLGTHAYRMRGRSGTGFPLFPVHGDVRANVERMPGHGRCPACRALGRRFSV